MKREKGWTREKGRIKKKIKMKWLNIKAFVAKQITK
jgi:hypothetical protein